FFLALILPWLEVICGFCLIAGILREASALLLSLLLVAFLILITSTIIRGIDIDCGCFGSLSRKVDFKLIITDLFLLFMSLTIFFSFKRDGISKFG
ncbi:MAG: MauE/DoxX family redox-associated membrane protein, partial [Candidatus Aminicenantales bacterium]